MIKHFYAVISCCIFLICCDTNKRAIITSEPQVVEKSMDDGSSKQAKNIILMVGRWNGHHTDYFWSIQQ